MITKLTLIVFVVVLSGIVLVWWTMPKGPFCQSCAIPMTTAELFGTEADGSPSKDYCRFCYHYGAFTEPDITMDAMIDKCVEHMVEQGVMPEAKARKLMTRYLPNTKRWKAQKRVSLAVQAKTATGH